MGLNLDELRRCWPRTSDPQHRAAERQQPTRLLEAAAAGYYARLEQEAEALHGMGLQLIPVICQDLPPTRWPAKNRDGSPKLDKNGRPFPAFTGKNPSCWRGPDQPQLLSHKRPPTLQGVRDSIEVARRHGLLLGLGVVPSTTVVVIDFDAKDYGGDANALDADFLRLVEAHPELKRTRIERTPRSGLHLYVRVADGMASWSNGRGGHYCSFTTAEGGPHRGEVLTGTRIAVTAPTDDGYFLTGDPDYGHQLVEVENLAAIGIRPHVQERQRQQQAPLSLSADPPRPAPAPQQAGMIDAPALGLLLGRKAREVLTGGHPYGEDRSTNYTGFLRELHGVENWLSAEGLPFTGTADQLKARAIAALGIEDKADRVADTIEPSGCRALEPDKLRHRYEWLASGGQQQSSDTPPAGGQDAEASAPFDAAWQAMEALADELAAGSAPYLKQQAAMRWHSSQHGLNLGTRGVEQLLEAAQRRRRPAATPPPMGGAFRVRSRPWAVQGLLRSGLNLLVGASGGGKSRFAAYIAAQWLYGSPSLLGFPIHGPAVANRRVLILGTDQDREDWRQTLEPFGLLQAEEEGGEWTTVRLHPRLELLPLEAGVRLDADGLGLIRSRADLYGSGLLVVADSLAKLLPDGIDEDKAAAAGPVYALVEALGDGWALLLHHTRKAAGKEQNLGVGAGRGSGAIDAAASRVIGLGLIHRMEHGQMVADETSPERELLSTKRGGPTVHLIVRMDAGNWSLVGDAGEQKRERQREQQRKNLTKDQARVLEVLDAKAGQFLTTRQVAEGMGIDWEADVKAGKPKAAALRKRLRRLADLGLVEPDRVANENTYRATPCGEWEDPYESPEREADRREERKPAAVREEEQLDHLREAKHRRELAEMEAAPLAHESPETGSLGSPIAITKESLAPLPAPTGSHWLPSSPGTDLKDSPPSGGPPADGEQAGASGSHQGSRSEPAPPLRGAEGATPTSAEGSGPPFRPGDPVEVWSAPLKQWRGGWAVAGPLDAEGRLPLTNGSGRRQHVSPRNLRPTGGQEAA
jgi:hypothetical protein